MVKFFYGISGTFKGVTLAAENIASEGCIKEIRSMIKPWKDIMGRIFTNTKQEDHRDYTLLHLCILEHGISEAKMWWPEKEDCIEKDVNIERGVTDSLYYWLRGKVYGQSEMDSISRAVEEELRIVSGMGDIKKILLVNKDEKFIRDVVLKEPHRAKVFPGGVSEYLREQDNYVSFTGRWNNITDIREITNARDYIEGLGLKYIESYGS